MRAKIGEIVSASVSGGLAAKLELDNPEDLRIGYPVIVEGKTYDFYCIVEDVMNQNVDIAERLAGSALRDSIVPSGTTHEGYGGRIFYSKAVLRPIQLIDKETNELSEPQTIPPYFAEARHATREDVERIYEINKHSAPVGSIRGVEEFMVHLDFEKLTEKPFGIFGRTGMGKSILNKLVCVGILAKRVGSVLIFDMHGEYGIYSRGDNTEGLKYYFPERVEVFSLDPKNTESRPFIINPRDIRPEDLIVSMRDLNQNMRDAIYEIDRTRAGTDLVRAIRDMDPGVCDEGKIHLSVLNAVKRRIGRLNRFTFVRGGKDTFKQMVELIKDGKSIVLDFGDYGTDQMVYLFVANILARRLFNLYVEKNGESPRLIVFLEEAHKFLEPDIASYTIFNRLARETRKFNLILALIDQRPSRIDDEVRSQLANRLVMSLKEPSDISSSLAGVPDRSMWEMIIGTVPARTVAVMGDAIRIPTVINIMTYTPENVRTHIIGEGTGISNDKIDRIAKQSTTVLDF
ncbi:MAG: ATP-binding protein [Methanomassiliicoccales archaeon]|nr:MAG: ATP-binding protein [Methanomassiliicoccales archaeon]